MLYYAFCIAMGRPEQEFFESSIGKVTWIVLCATNGYMGNSNQGNAQQVYSQADFWR